MAQESSTTNVTTQAAPTTRQDVTANSKRPDFAVHNPDTGQDITPNLCPNCRAFELGHQIEHVKTESWHNTKKKTSVFIHPLSNCPLCRFFGSIITKDHECAKEDRNHGIMVETMIETGRSYVSTPYEVDPCAITVYSEDAMSTRDRVLLPIRDGRVCSRPRMRTQPLYGSCFDFQLGVEWIANCERYHEQSCPTVAASQWDEDLLLGFRVIDCRTQTVVQGAADLSYVALSYVWGNADDKQDTESTLTDQEHQSEASSFPKTVQDAITVSIKLGFHYLWVDKYCINQSDARETAYQIQGMNRIYQNATLTIIAAAGDNAEYGLPGIRSDSREPQLRLTINGITYLSVIENASHLVRDSVWNSRAWTYQEGFFSTRRLIFTDERVFFQCNESYLAESTTVKEGNPSELNKTERNSQFEDFMNYKTAVISGPKSKRSILKHLEAYARRQMTYQSDVLNAIQGLLSSFKHDLQIKDSLNTSGETFNHLWGIPTTLQTYHDNLRSISAREKRIVSHLDRQKRLWAAMAYGLSWTIDYFANKRSRRSGFPSWSWAGWIAEVMWPDYDKECGPVENLPEWVGLKMSNGSFKVLTMELVDDLDRASHREKGLFTYQLGIVTDLYSVRLSESPENKTKIAIKAKHRSGKTETEGECYIVWRVEITPSFVIGDSLHQQLLTDTYELAVISNYGLLLQKRGDIHERIGIVLDLRGKHHGSPFQCSAGAAELRKKDRLAKYFHGRRERIVIG